MFDQNMLCCRIEDMVKAVIKICGITLNLFYFKPHRK